MYRRLIAATALGTTLLAGTAGTSHAASSTRAQAGHAGIMRQIAAVEGVTPQVLRQDLQQGQTLLQIAGSRYGDANALATALLTPVKTRLDKAVSAGRMGAGQESLLYANLLARTSALTVVPHPAAALVRLRGAATVRHGAGIVKITATACNTTPRDLRTALRAGGASVLAICRRTNPAQTQDGLTTAIYAPIKGRLAKAVTAGKLTAAQESQVGVTIQQALGAAITATLPAAPAAGA